jgi:mersacidin/lichenicidin family type 2 lantibiotic
MSRTIDVVRAWKDPEYRDSLTAEERAQLPPHPAGLIELSKADLALVAGGDGGASLPTIVMSNGGSGGTQCTAHSCPPMPFNPTIYINPNPLVVGGK